MCDVDWTGTGTNCCYLEDLEKVELWTGDRDEPRQVCHHSIHSYTVRLVKYTVQRRLQHLSHTAGCDVVEQWGSHEGWAHFGLDPQA